MTTDIENTTQDEVMESAINEIRIIMSKNESKELEKLRLERVLLVVYYKGGHDTLKKL